MKENKEPYFVLYIKQINESSSGMERDARARPSPKST